MVDQGPGPAALVAVGVSQQRYGTCWFLAGKGTIDAAIALIELLGHFGNHRDFLPERYQLLNCGQLAGSLDQYRMDRFATAK